jgi:hypothetical protein
VNGSSADLDRFQEWGLDAARGAKHAQFLKRSADLMWAPIDRAYDGLSDSVESNQAFEAGAFEDLKHSYGYLLLVGAAVETMLKAAAIQRVLNTDGRRSLLSEDGHRLQRWLTNHKLRDLSQRAGLTALSADEVQHLERLEEYIVWAVRYLARKEFVEPEAESRTTNHRVGTTTGSGGYSRPLRHRGERAAARSCGPRRRCVRDA